MMKLYHRLMPIFENFIVLPPRNQQFRESYRIRPGRFTVLLAVFQLRVIPFKIVKLFGWLDVKNQIMILPWFAWILFLFESIFRYDTRPF